MRENKEGVVVCSVNRDRRELIGPRQSLGDWLNVGASLATRLQLMCELCIYHLKHWIRKSPTCQ